MDETSFGILNSLKLPSIKPILINDFEKDDHDLLEAKKNRRLIEYYFTCTPSLPLFILQKNPEVELITYLDADIFFFRDPLPVYDEMGSSSILIIEHKFPKSKINESVNGIYNVGWVSFRRDANGIECLNWWRQKCNEWCYDRVEGDKCADQKYLDDWPTRFKNVAVSRLKGVNVAPWNIANYYVNYDKNIVMVDEEPLIFFHFHGLKNISSSIYDTCLSSFDAHLTHIIRDNIYLPYMKLFRSIDEEFNISLISQDRIPIRRHNSKNIIYNVVGKFRFMRKILSTIIKGNFIYLK